MYKKDIKAILNKSFPEVAAKSIKEVTSDIHAIVNVKGRLDYNVLYSYLNKVTSEDYAKSVGFQIVKHMSMVK
jgi:hypothetical protein